MRTLMITTLAAGMALSGCTTDPNTGQQKISKAALGGLAGAALGAGVAKSNADSDKMGRAAAIGAALGAGVGLYMDQQEKKLREQTAGTGIEVDRDEQGNIDLIMPGAITFATDSTSINPQFRGTLSQVANTLSGYNETTITVKGFTDNTGRASYNQNLSERRAASVASYLISQGVASNRINTVGYGESYPVATNATEQGRAQNRRVELTINAPQQLSQ